MLELTTIIHDWLRTIYQHHKIEIFTYHHWGDEIMISFNGIYDCVLMVVETTVQVGSSQSYSEIFNAADPELFKKLKNELASRMNT